MKYKHQPPSGGCVLKRSLRACLLIVTSPAAFRRLCVETGEIGLELAFRPQPPSGGCVLKLETEGFGRFGDASRLQAAVC